MGTHSTLRTAILNRIKTVSNYGNAYDRERLIVDWTKYLTEFLSTISGVKQYRGWWVSWDGIPESGGDGERACSVAELYRYTVRGIQGVDDSAGTEVTFGDLVESVVAALRTQKDFGDAGVIDFTTRVTVPTVEARQFGSVLCHYCEIRIDVTVLTDIIWG